MKHTKRFLLTLALAFTGVLASWAQDEVTVNTTANANEWTLEMPDADVELEVEYYTDEEAPFIDGVELTANSDGTWSLAEMPGFDIELEVEYYTDEEVNQMAADEVITKINAIGTVEYTDACKALIDAAREAYDALTDAQKALVSEETLKVLTDAEAAYAELKAAAEQAAADQAAADAAIAKINAIGTVEYTDACKALIDAAREAYDALTDAQKALVSEETLKVLTDAEAAYAELKAAAEQAAADQAAADAVIAKINAIGTVEYTDACKALIDAAREAYDALTDAQKALVSEETLKVLTDAEEEYARLAAIATGIGSVKATNKADVWYDLSGQRLNGKPTKKGIYFCNGKKVVVK